MTMLESRCTQSLKCLEFTHNTNLPPQYFSNFLGHFKNLTKLNVCASMVDDCSFIIIGENCSKLVELNAASTWLTNNGLKGMSVDDVIIPGLPTIYRLPNLVLIDVSDTRVTPEGLSLFLVCHPNLVKLEHRENFHSFRLAKIQNSCNSTYALRYLSSIDVYLSPDDYEYALDHCPRLEGVTLTCAGLTNENLYKLMTVKSLTQLHLGNKNSQSFNFFEGVAPVLAEVGVTLKKLVLEDFTEVDVDFIGEKCPMLEHLALSGILTYAPMGNNYKPHFFTKLTSLELWNKIGQNHELAVSDNVLIQLLFRAPLTYLLLQRVGSLTDDLFSMILGMNPLLTLRNVVIDYCHNVSGKIFWMLLEHPNNLSVMRSWHNKGTTETDKNAIKSVIKEENLLLYWEWYPYNEYEELLDAGQIRLESDEEEYE